jgi:hypothetical protein
MAAAFGYSTRTLNDNWCEDRCQPPGSQSAVGDPSKPKTIRKYETDIAYIGERYDILTRIARVPFGESYATPDDGFREKARTSSVDFADPRSHKEIVKNAPELAKFITSETIAEVCHEERRPIPGFARGFGSVLDRHDHHHGERHWNTASGDAFGIRQIKPQRSCPTLMSPAGLTTEHEENRMPGMKVGLLCGEEFRNNGNPSNDTNIQRAWVQDASLRNIHHGGTKPRVRGVLDNSLSVPLGDGQMTKIRKDLAERQGKLFKVATNITKGRDKKPGVAIFKDDP